MSEPLAMIKEELGKNIKFSYEVIFNLHLNRLNEMVPQLVHKGGVDPYELIAIYSSIRLMNSLVLAGRPRGTYTVDIKEKLDQLKKTLDLDRIANLSNKEVEKDKVKALYEMHDVIDFMVGQMNPLGLIPPEDEEVVIPTIITREDYVWKPGPEDFDYLLLEEDEKLPREEKDKKLKELVSVKSKEENEEDEWKEEKELGKIELKKMIQAEEEAERNKLAKLEMRKIIEAEIKAEKEAEQNGQQAVSATG